MVNDIEGRYKKLHPKSYRMWQENLNYLPGGTPAQGQCKEPFPIYFSKAKGSRGKRPYMDNRGYCEAS